MSLFGVTSDSQYVANLIDRGVSVSVLDCNKKSNKKSRCKFCSIFLLESKNREPGFGKLVHLWAVLVHPLASIIPWCPR